MGSSQKYYLVEQTEDPYEKKILLKTDFKGNKNKKIDLDKEFYETIKHGKVKVLKISDSTEELEKILQEGSSQQHSTKQSEPAQEDNEVVNEISTQDEQDEMSDNDADNPETKTLAVPKYIDKKEDTSPYFMGGYDKVRQQYGIVFDSVILVLLGILFFYWFNAKMDCSCPVHPEFPDLTELKGRLANLEEKNNEFSSQIFPNKLEHLKSGLMNEMSDRIEPLSRTMDQVQKDFGEQTVNVNTKVSEMSQKKDEIEFVIETFKKETNNSIGQTMINIQNQQDSFESQLKTDMRADIQKAESNIPFIIEEKVAKYNDGKWNEYIRQTEEQVLKSDLFQSLKVGYENVTSRIEALYVGNNMQKSQTHRLKREVFRIRILMDLSSDQLKDDLNKTHNKLNTIEQRTWDGVLKLNSTLRENIKHKVASLTTVLTTKLRRLDVSVKHNIGVVKQTLKISEHNVMNLQDDSRRVKAELDQIKSWKDGISEWKIRQVEPAMQKLASIKGNVEYLNQQGSDTNVLLYLVIAIIAGLVLLVVFLMLKLQNVTQTTDSGVKKFLHASENVLSKVQPDIANDKSVCNISFNDSTQNLHGQLTKSVMRDKDGIMMKKHHLKDHSSIQSIPHSKICIIYVDYNERNIILEDPESELGDIKRTTVKAVKKMGATAVVVYIHDEGSKSLEDGHLYNPRLSSIKRHPVLCDLSGKHRVYSTYDSFTDHQKQQLRQLITESTK